MSLYEMTYILRHDLSKQEVDTIAESVENTLKERGGSIRKTEYWGLRSLAYKINKHSKGHYTHMGIDAPFEAIAEVERTMRLNEDVMRLMTVKVDAISDEPSPLLKKSDDDDYDRDAA